MRSVNNSRHQTRQQRRNQQQFIIYIYLYIYVFRSWVHYIPNLICTTELLNQQDFLSITQIRPQFYMNRATYLVSVRSSHRNVWISKKKNFAQPILAGCIFWLWIAGRQIHPLLTLLVYWINYNLSLKKRRTQIRIHVYYQLLKFVILI